MMPKKTAGDYRALNNATILGRYSIPHIQDFTTKLHGVPIFSKLDLVSAYHQVPVGPSDVSKMAVITPFKLFEIVRMPLGLRNAAQTFQHFMDQVIRGLTFVYNYIHDILIASKGSEDHRNHLRMVFECLQAQEILTLLYLEYRSDARYNTHAF